jgi:hypothetical protein
MHNQWFNFAVLVLWLTMMSWLISQKVLPALLVGDPPNYPTILAAQRQQPVVGWLMLWNGERLGWALTRTKPLPHELTEIDSRIHFDQLPIGDMAPDWLRSMFQPLGQMRSKLPMDTVSTLVFDPLGRLCRFESAVQFQPKVDALKVKGSIDGGTLSLIARAGEFAYETEMPMPGKTMLTDSLSPQVRLPGLREGQRWTVEVYSPFRPPNSPREILQAEVEGRQPVRWEGRIVHAWLVVYRSDPGAAISPTEETRGRLWVHPDGTVIKQEARFFNATMTLTRLPERATRELASTVGNDDELGYDGVGRQTDGGRTRQEVSDSL